MYTKFYVNCSEKINFMQIFITEWSEQQTQTSDWRRFFRFPFSLLFLLMRVLLSYFLILWYLLNSCLRLFAFCHSTIQDILTLFQLIYAFSLSMSLTNKVYSPENILPMILKATELAPFLGKLYCFFIPREVY